MMDDWISQRWQEITARPGGPLALRFYLQPTIAMVLAIRDGVRDARSGQPAFLWAAVTDAEHRRAILRSGWRSVGKVFLVALVLDLVYQLVVLNGLRPVQAVLLAAVLALVPYVVLRGPINRIVRLRGTRQPPPATPRV